MWLYCWWCFGKCLVVIVVLLVGQLVVLLVGEQLVLLLVGEVIWLAEDYTAWLGFFTAGG